MEPTVIFDTENKSTITLCSLTRTSAPHLSPSAQSVPEIFNIERSKMVTELKEHLKVKPDV
jgi:hypothetical protein